MGVEVVNDLLERVAEGAHADDDAGRVLGAVVVEQVIVGAELLVHLVHVVFDHVRQRVVSLVAGLAVLEEDVAVLVRAARVRVLRVEGVVAERLDGVHVAQLSEVVVVPNGDLLNLVGGAEAVKEVDERHAALDGGEVRDGREVHDLLDAALGEHGEAGLTAGHDVGVVAEDVQGMARHGTGGDMEHRRQALARDLVHVGDHEQQALRRGVRRGQSASAKRAVDGTGGASLGLHLDNLNGGAEDVLLASSCPLVDIVGHGAGRGDRVNARHLSKRIRHVRRGVVTVHGLKLTSHILSFSKTDRAPRPGTFPYLRGYPQWGGPSPVRPDALESQHATYLS